MICLTSLFNARAIERAILVLPTPTEREREREEEGKKSGGREREVRDINKDIFGVPEAYCMTYTHTHTHPLIQTLQMSTH